MSTDQPNPFQAPQKQSGYQTPVNMPMGQESNTLAIVSLILGILSLTIGCCCWTHVPLGIAAAVTGYLGMQKAQQLQNGHGMALAGLICGSIALVLYTALAIFGLAFNVMSAAAGA